MYGTFGNNIIFHNAVFDLSTNTYIGGIATTIATSSALAAKLGISVGAISNFSVVNSNIKCKITGSYVIPYQAFRGMNISYFTDLDNLVTNIGSEAFANVPNPCILSFKGVVSLTGAFIISMSRNMTIELDNCTTISNGAFGDIINSTIYIPRCVNLGSTSGNNLVFQYSKSSKIYCHSSLSTSNSGGVEGDIVDMISRGGTVVYVTNFTAPNPVTTLATGTIYKSAVQLIFTPPSGTNSIEFYEVYVDGIFNNKIYASGEYGTGLIPSTYYNITIYAIDIYYNKSLVSNTVTQSTNIITATPTSGLVSYYKMDETSGTTANDAFGSQNLTNTNVSINQIGKNGTSYLSTALGQKLETTSASAITGNFTINLWIYRTAQPSILGGVFQQGDYSTANGFGLWFWSSGNLSWRINTTFSSDSSAFAVSLNTWTMVTMVYNQTNVKIYLSGILQSTTPHTANPITVTKRTLFYNLNNNAEFFGKIDEVSIYNTALTRSQIDLIYNNGNGITL